MTLANKRVLITGVGVKPLGFVFYDITTGEPTHTSIKADDQEYKVNIGAAVALECAKAGAVVHLVSRSEDKLRIVKNWIESVVPGAKVEYSAVDLSDIEQLNKLVSSIPDDLPLYWVQSVGLGAGTVKVKDDNPYLLIENIPQELIQAELSVLTNTVTLLQLLLPRFRKQKETRICIISSMSAVRSVVSGSMHMAAKGAISRFANAAMIELHDDNIFVTDVRPGAIDTGMYDSKAVQDTVNMIAQKYGKKEIHYAPPHAVGQAIVTVFTSDGHITTLDMVGKGQFPHSGS